MYGASFSNEVASKLLLLILQFPKLKIIWSQSPSATSEVFEDLKVKRNCTFLCYTD